MEREREMDRSQGRKRSGDKIMVEVSHTAICRDDSF